ncbi:MAG: AAA family ATPase, partial [Candidatus Omnitrophica bacterium]|nr:AAA family ATPase [Candidatus Omnitrophota bacterium]
MIIKRYINLSELVKAKSYFLLGPRQTGKSFLIQHQLKADYLYNLLEPRTFLSLSQNVGLMTQQVLKKNAFVVIDEIQRLPDLLNEAHLLIEEKNCRFLLTGSSARKLRRGGVNLLGGRARIQYLHPLTFLELGSRFDLKRILHSGSLPAIYFSSNADADLESYASVYLEQEIMAEGVTRNVPAFSRFLKFAALCNGTIVNFTNMANDAQIPRTTIYEYFDILKDTLILFELPAYRQTKKRKPICSSKYYFFDIGVLRKLQGRRMFSEGTKEYGEAFETYVMHELICARDYGLIEDIAFWRSTSGFEVDFLIGGHTAIEVKAKTNISTEDLKPLRA